MLISNTPIILLVCTCFPVIVVAFSQTKANWCRHVSILSRSSKNATKTTECYIPIRREAKESLTLRDTIEEEWKWILNRPETVNGQVFVIDDKTVTLLSQKVCLDAGKVTSYPVTFLYNTIGNKSVPFALAGNFDSPPSPEGDIYKSCVENPTTWRNFTIKKTLRDNGDTKPKKLKQFLQIHTGQHEGLGTELVPFDFSYTSADLEDTLQIAMRAARTGNNQERKVLSDSIKSGKPVLRNVVPYETGHAMLSINTTTALYHDLYQDTTIVAWNRLLEAVASLSGRPTPPVLLPEKIQQYDFMELTVLSVISIITFKMALSSVTAARRTHVMHWEPPRHSRRTKHWTLIRTAAEHSDLANYQPPSRAQDFSGPSVALLVAAVTLIQALLHFSQTNLRYTEFVIVRQGGLMTYGPSDYTKWSNDLKNEFAGAIFVVGHWCVFQIVKNGSPGRFEAIAGMYGLLLLVLCYILYKFSTLREHQLDRYFFRVALTAFRAVLQAVVGAVVRITPSGRGYGILSSYRSTYLNLTRELANEYDLHITPDDSFSSWWDGVLVPPSRNRPEQAGLNVRMVLQDSEDFGIEDAVKLTEDDIEKACAFLAADRYGRLHYWQVIALLSCPKLLHSADVLRRSGKMPGPTEIRGFALLFYLTGILLPERSDGENAVSANKFRVFDTRKDMPTLQKIKNNFVMLLAAPPGMFKEEEETLSLDGLGFGVLSEE